jgi:hypothetical protein
MGGILVDPSKVQDVLS